jgi:hypothetical protein
MDLGARHTLSASSSYGISSEQKRKRFFTTRSIASKLLSSGQPQLVVTYAETARGYRTHGRQTTSLPPTQLHLWQQHIGLVMQNAETNRFRQYSVRSKLKIRFGKIYKPDFTIPALRQGKITK